MRAATALWGGHELPRHPGCRRRLAADGGDLGHRRGRSVVVAEASYRQDGSGPGVAATAAAPAAIAPAAVAPAAAAPEAEALTEYVVVDHGYPCFPHRARPHHRGDYRGARDSCWSQDQVPPRHGNTARRGTACLRGLMGAAPPADVVASSRCVPVTKTDAGACPVGTTDCCRERVLQDLDLAAGADTECGRQLLR